MQVIFGLAWSGCSVYSRPHASGRKPRVQTLPRSYRCARCQRFLHCFLGVLGAGHQPLHAGSHREGAQLHARGDRKGDLEGRRSFCKLEGPDSQAALRHSQEVGLIRLQTSVTFPTCVQQLTSVDSQTMLRCSREVGHFSISLSHATQSVTSPIIQHIPHITVESKLPPALLEAVNKVELPNNRQARPGFQYLQIFGFDTSCTVCHVFNVSNRQTLVRYSHEVGFVTFSTLRASLSDIWPSLCFQ